MNPTLFPAHLEPDIRWYDRLQFRVSLLVIAAVVLTIGVTAGMFVRVTGHHLRQAMGRTTTSLADRVALHVQPALASRPGQDVGENIERAVAPILDDPCFGFAVIEDERGQVLVNIVAEPGLWYEFAIRVGLSPGGTAHALFGTNEGTDAGHSLSGLPTSTMPEAMLIRQPIYASPTPEHPSSGADGDRPIGYATVASLDPIQRRTLINLQRTAVVGVILVTLCSIPVTVVVVRQVTQPLRLITRATALLATGHAPPPLPVSRSDEIGILARAFNETAASLAEASEQLRASNARLEMQVQARTEEIRHINERLEVEIRNKNEFLRTVSHDLNAPLRNIAGMTEMIRQRFGSDLPAEVLSRLDRISANVDAETSMLDDLLELSRLRTDPATPEPVDLNELVQHVQATLDHEMRTRGIEFSVAGRLPVLFVEPGLMRQVLLNLMDNAVKYMGEGAVRRIALGHARGERAVEIWVEDTGRGIDPADHQSIFQVFQRGRLPTAADAVGQAPPPSGRGIGLAGVRVVAERWGGRVDLISAPGAGSRFTLVLPIERLCSPEEQTAGVSGSAGSASAFAGFGSAKPG